MHIVLLCSDWAKRMESKAHDTEFKEIGMIQFHSQDFREEQAYKFFPPYYGCFITIEISSMICTFKPTKNHYISLKTIHDVVIQHIFK